MSELPSFLKSVELSIFGPNEPAEMSVNLRVPKWENGHVIEDDFVDLFQGDVIVVVGTYASKRNTYKIVNTPYGNQALLLESLKVLPVKPSGTVD